MLIAATAQIHALAVAELGSDPNSGQGLGACQQGFTDLGSDPNSVGFTLTAFSCDVSWNDCGRATPPATMT